MVNLKQIRPLAICVFGKDNRILVAEGFDPIKQQIFYRPLGGAIKFGEYSHEALVREIREEIGAEITNLRYLGTIENIFTFCGEVGHEIVLVYDGAFSDNTLYTKECLKGEDDCGLFRAVWKFLTDFQNDQPPLYPDGLFELLLAHRKSTNDENI